MKLQESIIQAPILRYPDHNKRYIVYTNASDDACGAQLSQENDGTEFPIAFLLHTFSETQRKWSTTEQEAYEFITLPNGLYLQGADIVVRNDHKLLNRFLNGKNANNKVNRWGLELATYNIPFEWISGAHNKAADCLSCLLELPRATPAQINMLSVTNFDGPAFNTRSQTCLHLSLDTSTSQPDITPEVSEVTVSTPKSLFTHVRGLPFKHFTDSGQKLLTLVIPKSWKYTVLVEAKDKLGHQGNTHTYCLIKCQYYWKV